MIRTKNPIGFELLYARYYRLLFSTAYAVLRQESDAMDAVQNAALRLYTMDESLFPSDHELAWLHTVVKNEALMVLRKKKPEHSVDELPEIPVPERQLEMLEDMETVQSMLSSLDQKRQNVVTLKVLSGLAPETEYQFTVRFKLATNVENDMIGIGGAPGESVFVKCGVASEEPENSLDSLNHFRLNIDKGSQSTGGADMIVVGNLAKKEINRPGEYEFNEIETKVIARIDEAGTAYLVIGTDSGFEGVTSYYLDDISVSWADTSEVSVTRGDAAKMLLDHAHRWDEIVGTPTFTDVAWEAPYAEAVAWAEQNGYLGGYGNGFFGPEDAMTVEQAMVMIYRLFGGLK